MKLVKIAAFVIVLAPVGFEARADNAEAFQSATKVSQLKALGAKQMDGASIKKVVSGRTLKNPGWTWTFKKNGKQNSAANDGSWEDSGTWAVKGNELCRASVLTKGEEWCSKVYFLGRDLKFSKVKSDLNEWFISY